MAKKALRGLTLACQSCHAYLVQYAKMGTGALIKLRTSRIIEDFTLGDGKCQQCGQTFARPFTLKGERAWQLVGGKSFFVRSRKRN
ncbi:Yippee domain-containing protein [Plasmodiophora brassicae]|uniref:Yippee domain-containing protein n=1 Tax=Plasmodiophora brassicae TaxID=37360 RepID=A0A0G4IVJ6_PLABS|nr:hypothetical protein PBRA_001279 [Plasmodiophora brassicae]